MARIARVVAVGYPHHVTQRGKRRQPVFFKEENYGAYLDLVAARRAPSSRKNRVPGRM